MDEFTREGLATMVGRSFKAMQVKEVLAKVGEKCGFPQFIRSDKILLLAQRELWRSAKCVPTKGFKSSGRKIDTFLSGSKVSCMKLSRATAS
jgi:hypothetical protein